MRKMPCTRRNGSLLANCVLLLLGVCFRLEDAFCAGGTLHLKNAVVYTVTGPVLKDADVVIRNGVIDKIGQSLGTPPGAKVIDCRGKVVMPGFVVAGQVWDLGSPPDGVDVFAPIFPFALGSGVTCARAGSYAVKLTYREPKELILSRLHITGLSIRSWRGRFRLRRALLKAREFLRKRQTAGPKGAQMRPSGEAASYLPLLEKKTTGWLDSNRAQDILAACSLAREFDFPLVIEGGAEAWAVAEEIGRAHGSVILSIRYLTGPRRDADSPPGSNVRACAILRKAGVPFALIPPDTGLSITGGIAGRDITSLAMEAAFAVRGGLDEATALQAITIEPARILGVAHRVGSIEPGKDGDLVVLSGHPLDFKTVVDLAIINGKVYYDRSKSDLLPAPGASGTEPP